MSTRSLSLMVILAAAAWSADPDGAALYKQKCATCHEGPAQARMPTRQEIAARTPEAVYQAMFAGAMVPQSAGLTPDEGRAIARFVTAKEFGARTAGGIGKCSGTPGAIRLTDTDWNGWGSDLGNTRFQPKPGLTAADVPK